MGRQEAYIEDPNVTGEILLVPTPSAPGTFSGVYLPVPTPITNDNLGASVLLIPNFFTYGIKYGVMAEMFSKQGEANDPLRAVYCEQRYKEAVALARATQGLRK